MTRLSIPLGIHLGMVDRPGGRRQHQGIIPRTGGLGMSVAFILTVLIAIFLPLIAPGVASEWLPPRNDVNEMRRLTALLVGAAFCVVAGFLDDRFDWPSGPQYVVQIGCAVIAILGLIILKHVNNPFGEGFIGGPDGLPWWLVWPLTILWFAGTMNTINFLDGLSGLVAGVTAILCIVLAVHMLFRAEEPQMSVAILPIVLLGATLGFLPFNFSPAKVFMGSSGSYFLGFAIAALGIIGGARMAAVMLVLGLPILDVAWLIIQRPRQGRSLNEGGRDHLHFRLLDSGINERVIVLSYWGFCALFGVMTLLLDDRLYKLFALTGLGIIGLWVLYWANQRE
ncbi:MAG: MraY family glycosyltransferase [Chloroflexota bacterium]